VRPTYRNFFLTGALAVQRHKARRGYVMDTRLARLAPAPLGNSFAEALLLGFARTPKEIACKYFYDEAGSRLFDQICELPEYYPTRTESALLQRHASEIATLMGPDVEIVEFGAGSLRKVRLLLDTLKNPRAYTPVDISGDHLADRVRTLNADYAGLILRPLVADFTLPMTIPTLLGRPRRAGLFTGSTIGNFKPDAAIALLRRMRGMLDGGGLLVGVDLVKDPRRLHAAYNDKAGITAAFNKNLLVRANRELGTDFDLDAFAHYAPYNASARRIEMYLVSLKRQSVTVGDQHFEFAQGEPVHTEDSYKYTTESFRELAARAGFSPRAVWTDPERLLSVHWLES
jgi:dimethylhistidine N-methyltransferase